MAIPTLPKRLPRDRTLSMRVSSQTLESLKMLASITNQTQSDIVEILVTQEIERMGKQATSRGADKKKP